jgi:hypothetical protein
MPAGSLTRDTMRQLKFRSRGNMNVDGVLMPKRRSKLRKKIEMLLAHLKRILKLDRLRLRGPNGARNEFLLAGTAQNLKLAKSIPEPRLKPA